MAETLCGVDRTLCICWSMIGAVGILYYAVANREKDRQLREQPRRWAPLPPEEPEPEDEWDIPDEYGLTGWDYIAMMDTVGDDYESHG